MRVGFFDVVPDGLFVFVWISRRQSGPSEPQKYLAEHSEAGTQHVPSAACDFNHPPLVTPNIKVTRRVLLGNRRLIIHSYHRANPCTHSRIETVPAPAEKTQNKGIKDKVLKKKKKGRRSVMNISGIPELQAAAGFSSGREVLPARSHRTRTPQEALFSHY